jgi:hypothetical protein
MTTTTTNIDPSVPPVTKAQPDQANTRGDTSIMAAIYALYSVVQNFMGIISMFAGTLGTSSHNYSDKENQDLQKIQDEINKLNPTGKPDDTTPTLMSQLSAQLNTKQQQDSADVTFLNTQMQSMSDFVNDISQILKNIISNIQPFIGRSGYTASSIAG